MKKQHTDEFIVNMALNYPKKCVYQFILDENHINDTNIIQYFIMHGLGLCIKLDSFVAHMFYVWSFSYTTAVTIAINHGKYNIPLNTYNIVFVWGYQIQTKIKLNWEIYLYDKN